ncbi:MAG: flagellar motor stator protein MotA [Pseudomonadota bacterium]
MLSIVGMVIVVAMVFGGYLAAGGKIGIILQALPFEMMMIGGAAAGAFLLANPPALLKAVMRDLKTVFSGVRWHADDYRDLLCLLHALIKLGRRDPVALETHVEAPGESPIFQAYPKILADKEAVPIVCDTLRLTGMSFDDPNQLEDLLQRQLDARLRHALAPSHAVQTMADGLPALGIVAAVLGIIKTMASIDQPPEILGKMIGGALVGTFLGVFLAYGFVAPMASRLKEIAEEDHEFYVLIRDTLVANLHKHSTNVCVEIARQNISGHGRPSFDALDEALKAAPPEAA